MLNIVCPLRPPISLSVVLCVTNRAPSSDKLAPCCMFGQRLEAWDWYYLWHKIWVWAWGLWCSTCLDLHTHQLRPQVLVSDWGLKYYHFLQFTSLLVWGPIAWCILYCIIRYLIRWDLYGHSDELHWCIHNLNPLISYLYCFYNLLFARHGSVLNIDVIHPIFDLKKSLMLRIDEINLCLTNLMID